MRAIYFLLCLCYLLLSVSVAVAQFVEHSIFETETNFITSNIQLVDLNHDGHKDIIYLEVYRQGDHAESQIVWHANHGNGTFGLPQVIVKDDNEDNDYPVEFALADISGDNIPEVLYAAGFVHVLQNDGKGHFNERIPITYPPQDNDPRVRVVGTGDVDNDGDVDVLANFSLNHIDWYENLDNKLVINKDARFKGLNGNVRLILLLTGDLDGDGVLNVLSAYRSETDTDMYWHDNFSANGNYEAHLIDDISTFENMHVVDINNDQLPDVLGVASSNPNQIFWYENQAKDRSKVIFPKRKRKVISKPTDPKDVYFADLDMDGDPDVSYASQSTNTVAWYENLGNGNFGKERVISTTATGVVSISAGDVDGDGDPDIIFGGGHDGKKKIGWFENKILHVSSISTTSGTGGDQVILIGRNFSKSLQENTVKMGETAVAVVSVEQNGKELSFTAPAYLPQGTYPVTISTSNQSITLDDSFTLRQSLKSFSPASGTGNTPFTLTGTNFYASPGDNTVQLGATRLTVTKVSDGNTTLLSAIPASLSAGVYEVAVNGQSFEDSFSLLPNLLSFTPEAGKPGTSLFITGTNFGNDKSKITAQIGDTTAAIVSFNAEGTLLEVTVPELPEGEYALSVTVNDQTVKPVKLFSVLERDLALPEPVIASLIPMEGKPGALLTIAGENFGTNKALVSVLFNEIPAIPVSLRDSTITAIVPDLPAGNYQITVNVGDKTAAFEQDFILKENKPSDPFITAIVPNSGKPGEKISIVGRNFGTDIASLSVQLGDTPADVVALANSTIRIEVPSLTPGNYVVTIIIGDSSFMALQTFSISEETPPTSPAVSSLHPQVAKAGEIITIMGEHFGDDKNLISVMINDVIATINSVNDSTIIFTMPTLAPGTYEVKVMIGGEQISSLPTVIVNPTPDKDRTPPSLSFTFPHRYAAGSGELTLQVRTKDASGIAKAWFSLLKITENTQEIPWRTKPIVQNNNMYTVTLSPEDFDELGIQYQFSFEDSAGNTKATGVYYTYLQYLPDAAQKVTIQDVPPVRDHAKPTVQDYHLIALPFEAQPVHSIFEELGPPDDHSWKLFHYEEKQEETGTDREVYLKYPGTFSNFEPGKGYFFIYNKDTSLQVSGNVIEANAHKSFEILLAPGYNLIGNPYMYTINWNTVVEANPHLSNINLKTYNGENGFENDQILEAFEGGFVLNTSMQEVLLKIPVMAKQTAGGRYASGGSDNVQFEAPDWEIPIQLQTPHMTYKLGGIGMHTAAKEGIDPLDDFAPPRFPDYLEISFAHPEFDLARVTRDVVSVQDNYMWEFQTNTHLHNQEVTMRWDHQQLAHIHNDRQLILHDLQNLQLIDMRKNNTYTFTTSAGTRNFKIYYGNPETIYSNLLSQEFMMGSPYPNPASDEVNIPLVLPNTHQQYQVQLEIFNATGQRMYIAVHDPLVPGYHILQWNRNAVKPGIYVYRMHVEELSLSREGRIAIQ